MKQDFWILISVYLLPVYALFTTTLNAGMLFGCLSTKVGKEKQVILQVVGMVFMAGLLIAGIIFLPWITGAKDTQMIGSLHLIGGLIVLTSFVTGKAIGNWIRDGSKSRD